jgi:hypothetical protein
MLYKEELSWGRMIRLLATTPSLLSKLDPATHRRDKREKETRGGGGGWAWSRIIRPQESWTLKNIIQYSLKKILNFSWGLILPSWNTKRLVAQSTELTRGPPELVQHFR